MSEAQKLLEASLFLDPQNQKTRQFYNMIKNGQEVNLDN